MSLSRPSPPAPPPTTQQYEKTVATRAAEIEKEEKPIADAAAEKQKKEEKPIADAAAEKQKVEERKKAGRRKTILTSPQGLIAAAPTQKKKLLGE